MSPPAQTVLEPRKTPIQARSAASVDAILEATVQVLVSVGKERLTTTRVALRAGVSVGTLYQYFPNKSALLQATLGRHLERVTGAVELICRTQIGNSLEEMATALIDTFLNAKLGDARASAAFYSVSSDVDGMKIAQRMGVRSSKAIAEMLATTSTPLAVDPKLAASMLVGAMSGISRRLLESPAPEKHFDATRRELILLAVAYLRERSVPAVDGPAAC